MRTSPPVEDGSSEASSDGKAEGHPDHRCKPGRSPRRLVKKGRGDGVVVALGELRDEIDALAVDGAARANRDDDKAHVGRDVTVLVAPRMSRDRKVSRQARAVSVMSGNVSWSSGIKGLDVDENKRVGPVIVMEDDVRCVRDGVVLHPLVDRALTSVSATLRRDTRGAKGRVKEWDEGLDSGIMARGMESHAVRTWHKVSIARANQ